MSSVNWPLPTQRVSALSTEIEKKRIHDKCAFFFLVVLVSKQCVIIDGLGAGELLVYVHDLLLEVIQTVPVSQNVVGDVTFEALYA
jgi:hypothetical protein